MLLSKIVQENMKTTTRILGIANTLRVLAIVLTMGGASSFLPRQWIDAGVVQLGLQSVPDVALARYVQLWCGYSGISLGILLWVVAKDVVRHRPLVIATIAIFLIGAPAFYLINVTAGMPRWCAVTDFVCCLLGGGILLGFVMWPPALSPNDDPPANRRPAGQSDGLGEPWTRSLKVEHVPAGGR